VIENLRPGAINRLGLGYEALKAVKPDIIFVSMGMYGNDGPLAYQTGYAPCFVALGGLSALVGYEGEPPRGMNIRYADSTFGTAAAYAALVALMHARRTGIGQFVDVSAVETMTSMIGDTFMDYSLNGQIARCDGNKHPEMAPHGVYPCRDGDWIAIAASSDRAWKAICTVMRRADLAENPEFWDLRSRKANEGRLDGLIAEWTRSHDARNLAAELQAAGVAAAKSANSVDLVSDEHLWKREFYRYVTDVAGESRPVVGPAWRMSNAAAINDGAPHLGQHNAYIYGEVMGLSAKEQQRLMDAGVIH
jgi:crotonobetainyl-CoA:carnitine CoA-transferase CaiB-like acyl-CoA transferase